MKNNFHYHHDLFQGYSDKAIDYFTKSWKLQGIDREIILLYRKKYWEKAIKHLKLANG